MALPLYVPFGYITFLVGLLWLFSRHYRSRALRESPYICRDMSSSSSSFLNAEWASLAFVGRKPPPPWFPDPHTARDVYVSLLSMDPPPSQPVLVGEYEVVACVCVCVCVGCRMLMEGMKTEL